MVGASATRFFVGTAAGKVYRLDKTGGFTTDVGFRSLTGAAAGSVA